jgi:Flp pilus assembly protein TadG
MLPVLIGFAALTIDIGAMYNTRADLQRAADAAALAGVAALTSDTMMQYRDTANSALLFQVTTAATGEVNYFSGLNHSFGSNTMHIEAGDITTGWLDVTSSTTPIQGSPPAGAFPNAVRVAARRTSESTNGPLDLFFASIFGTSTSDLSAAAVAVFDDRVSGFDPESGSGYLVPFAISETIYQEGLAGGSDDYQYDGDTDSVSSGSDGVGEINLYPHNLAPGNFGLLNIGTLNQGAEAMAAQIENGVTGADLQAEVGTSDLVFFDSEGDPLHYHVTGNPGMTTSLTSSVETRVGDVIGFLLHSHVTDVGSNAVYRVVGIRFGRVMGIHLTGNEGQGLWVQPTTYAGSGVMISESAPSSGGVAGRLVLAR